MNDQMQHEPDAHEMARPRGGPDLPIAAADSSEASFDPIFDVLVKDETDIGGLVAYGLHALSRRDWHAAFMRAHGREPTPEEHHVFIIGERTQRRLAAYRAEGEAMLVSRIGDATPNRRSMPASVDLVPVTIAHAPPAPQQAADRSMMSDILQHLVGQPANAMPPVAKPNQNNLKAMLRYLVILLLLVGALALLVNYAKSTFFAN